MNVIFIDDELDRISVYAEDLQSNEKVTVRKFDELDKAFEYISNTDNKIDFVVLDIMMPGGNMFYNKEEDPMGMRSGFYLYQKIREIRPKLNIIIFTNVADEDIEEDIEKEQYTKLFYKDEKLPYELTNEIMSRYQ